MGMDAKVIIADLQLLCAAGLYGFGFAAQRAAMIEGMGPLTFNACRYIVSMVCNQKDMSIPNCRYIDVYRYILPRIIPLDSYFMFYRFFTLPTFLTNRIVHSVYVMY